jgi:hypothetical protein
VDILPDESSALNSHFCCHLIHYGYQRLDAIISAEKPPRQIKGRCGWKRWSLSSFLGGFCKQPLLAKPFVPSFLAAFNFFLAGSDHVL